MGKVKAIKEEQQRVWRKSRNVHKAPVSPLVSAVGSLFKPALHNPHKPALLCHEMWYFIPEFVWRFERSRMWMRASSSWRSNLQYSYLVLTVFVFHLRTFNKVVISTYFKWFCYHLLSLLSFQICFLSSVEQKIFWEMSYLIEVNSRQNCLINNIFICAPQKKKVHTGL